MNEATGTLQVANGSVPPSPASDDEEDEPPIPADQIEPLVRQVIKDYSNASLLLRLPGCIPIPAFDTDVPMPAEKWTNLEAHSFRQNIMDLLARDTSSIPACTCEAQSTPNGQQNSRRRRRKVIETPLIARPVANDVYTTQKRQATLSSLGIPSHQHDAETTKILVVSFGGQSIPKPSSSRPMTPVPGSRNGSISLENGVQLKSLNDLDGLLEAVKTSLDLNEKNDARSKTNGHVESPFQHTVMDYNSNGTNGHATPLDKSASQEAAPSSHNKALPTEEEMTSAALSRGKSAAPRLQRLMTQDHIYLPGAPPALHKPGQISSPPQMGARHRRKISLEIPKMYQSKGETGSSTVEEQIELTTIDASFESDSGSQSINAGQNNEVLSTSNEAGELPAEEDEQLIPKGWIAIVCGLSVKDGADELPENFYAAPRDVYVPDLTAICDVLLGKLGYGTCSETVSSQTPFVYGTSSMHFKLKVTKISSRLTFQLSAVPRPLFVEEFGLKRLMEASGTALPMTRADFEAGNWAKLIEQAYELGREKRQKHVEEFKKRVSSGIKEDSAACIIAKEVEKFMREEASLP